MTATVPKTLPLDVALQQAVAHHQAGRLQEAEQLYRTILQTLPNHPDANHNLGVLAGQLGQTKVALLHLRAALETNPYQGQYWLSYAAAELASGQASEALNIIQTAIRRGLDTPAMLSLRQNAEFAALNDSAKGAVPTPAERHQLIALFNAGRYAELERRASLLVERYPESGYFWKALGTSLQMQGKDALPALQKASHLMPDDAEAHSNLGAALQDLGQLDAAAASCRRALEIKPDLVGAHNNLGLVLQSLGQLDDAEASYRRALEIKPDFVEAHNNLGVVLQSLGQLDDAEASYCRALGINPDFTMAHSNVLYVHSYLADQSATESLAEARHFGALVARQARPHTAWPNIPDPNRRLRVGLVSGDLREHPVGFFVESVLATLKSKAAGRLEVFAYASHFRADAVTEGIKASCCGWRSAVGLSDENLAQRIRDDGIDILIDLSGHTAYNRLPLFAWKPAPVQATWLGYFATTGVTAIDYLIADPWTLPETEEANFTEKIWRLPETRLCFTPPNVGVEVVPLPALSNGYITFGCFNNLTKMNDDVVALWGRVLAAVPGSRLFLKAKQLREASVRQSIVERFSANGVAADRLILEGSTPRAEYLATYQRVDIALDPFPYTGGATSAEALWMGVPVLTLAGERFLSRQGIGLLMNAGLPEWIAADADDYVARAVSHASDLQRLAALRGGLRQQVLASPIFDATRFAHHFEAAMRGMWREWCG
jgi:predicted O-linked N-acetylglucosamine transferase (SPINDLY family)